MRSVRTGLAVALAVATAALAACGGGSSEAKDSSKGGLTTLKVAYTPIYTIGALQLGIDQGFFKDEGISLQLQQVANPPAGIAAVAGGQVDVNYAPTIPIFGASASGVGLKILAAADGNDPAGVAEAKTDPTQGVKYDDTAVVAGSDSGISRPRDLEGKTVSVPAREAQLEVTVAAAVKQDGGDPSKIKWITLDFATAVSSLKSGRIDAAGLVTPFIQQAVDNGGDIVSSPAVAFFGGGAVGMWVTSAKEQSAKPEAMAAFARAVEKSNAYAAAHIADEQKAAATTLKLDPKVVAGGSKPYFPTTIDAAQLQRTADQMQSLGYLDKLVDTSALLVAGN
jgi:ABC-type nitrate/sulfonate/bicarbonate transport system substrate-binding protein